MQRKQTFSQRILDKVAERGTPARVPPVTATSCRSTQQAGARDGTQFSLLSRSPGRGGSDLHPSPPSHPPPALGAATGPLHGASPRGGQRNPGASCYNSQTPQQRNGRGLQQQLGPRYTHQDVACSVRLCCQRLSVWGQDLSHTTSGLWPSKGQSSAVLVCTGLATQTPYDPLESRGMPAVRNLLGNRT